MRSWNCGRNFRTIGYHPLFECARCLSRILDAPLFIGSLLELSGYCWSAVRGENALMSHAATKFLAESNCDAYPSGPAKGRSVCGICGVVALDGVSRPNPAVVHAMADAMKHRGPDDEGFLLRGCLGFGFRRLSIIDLECGHQPMSNEQGNVWVVFNGEIYNYPALRRQLQQVGHVFRTRSDTEVVVHGYEEWGDDVLSHLNGMFSLAVWDEPRCRLLLARDRLGVKLLYYCVTAGSLYFASEIRALRAAGVAPTRVDPSCLYLFLRYRYTPSPLTLVDGVRKLAPGTRLVIENGLVQSSRWWDFAPRPMSPVPSLADATDELEALYKSAVDRHLLSDVPVGLLLSGGVDSALLLALMNEHGQRWPTFTVGYGESYDNDELSLAGRTAELLGARNEKVLIDRMTFERDLPKVVACLEEPVATSSISPDVPRMRACTRFSQGSLHRPGS